MGVSFQRLIWIQYACEIRFLLSGDPNNLIFARIPTKQKRIYINIFNVNCSNVPLIFCLMFIKGIEYGGIPWILAELLSLMATANRQFRIDCFWVHIIHLWSSISSLCYCQCHWPLSYYAHLKIFHKQQSNSSHK